MIQNTTETSSKSTVNDLKRDLNLSVAAISKAARNGQITDTTVKFLQDDLDACREAVQGQPNDKLVEVVTAADAVLEATDRLKETVEDPSLPLDEQWGYRQQAFAEFKDSAERLQVAMGFQAPQAEINAQFDTIVTEDFSRGL